MTGLPYKFVDTVPDPEHDGWLLNRFEVSAGDTYWYNGVCSRIHIMLYSERLSCEIWDLEWAVRNMKRLTEHQYECPELEEIFFNEWGELKVVPVDEK